MRMQNDDDDVVAMPVVRPLNHRCPVSRPRATSLPNLIGAPMPNHECANALAAVHVTPNWSQDNALVRHHPIPHPPGTTPYPPSRTRNHPPTHSQLSHSR
jgi:hypothetical protein